MEADRRDLSVSAQGKKVVLAILNPLFLNLYLTMAAGETELPVLPALPEGRHIEGGFRAVGKLSPPVMRKLEPVGPHFLAYARRVSRAYLLKILGSRKSNGS